MANPKQYSLEPAVQAFCEATSNPPFLQDLPPEIGRGAIGQIQAAPPNLPEVDEKWVEVPGGPNGPVKARIVRAKGSSGVQPVVLYTHGGGWVFGDANSHDWLVRDIAVGTGAAVVYPDYSLAPEAKYPTQNEEAYLVAKWIVENGKSENLDGSKIVTAGDSAGGNMAIVLNIMANERKDGVSFKAALLLDPVTDGSFDSGSYKEFADGYFLTRDLMIWFWNNYCPEEKRGEITASPLRATTEQLAFFPPTLLITAECDPLRDHGEAFGAKLCKAGVQITAVRYAGVTHDFCFVYMLHDTIAAKAATAQANAFIKAHLA